MSRSRSQHLDGRNNSLLIQDGRLSATASDRLMTRSEVEAQFGVPKRYLETAVAKGHGPAFVRIGRLVRYRAADISAWITSVREDPASVS